MAYNKNNKFLNTGIATFMGFLMLLSIFQFVRLSASADPMTAPITSPESTPSDNQGHNDNNQNNSNSQSNNTPAQCNDEKPHTAPVLLSWKRTGDDQITLNWSKSTGPVNYYVVSYGLKPHTPIYGSPKVGNETTTQTEVNNLDGSTTYYFTVEAANGCVHSDASNELTIRIDGVKSDSQGRVLAANSGNYYQKPVATPAPKANQNNGQNDLQSIIENKKPVGFFDSVINFFKLLFR